MWGDVNCKLDFDNILDENYNLDEVQASYRVKLSCEVIIWENMNFTCNNHEDLLGGGRWAYKACPTTDTHTNRMFVLVDCHIWDSIISNERKVFARDLSCIGTYPVAWKWECQSVWRWGINSMHVYYPLWVPQLHHLQGSSKYQSWVENRYGITKRLCVC